MPRQSTVIARELQMIRTSFSKIARSFGRIGPILSAPTIITSAPSGELAQPARKRPKLSPRQRAALKLQGKYMGTMRGLKPAQRSVIKKIRVEKGIRAAIAEAQKLASAS
jgi:hypothetical protein